MVVGDGEKDSSRSRSLSSRLRLSLLEEKVEERDWRLVREASWWARTSSSLTSWVEIRLGEDGEESKSSMNLEDILRIFWSIHFVEGRGERERERERKRIENRRK